jgi:hypothetical protein
MKYLFVGHSHISALKQGAVQLGLPDSRVCFVNFNRDKDVFLPGKSRPAENNVAMQDPDVVCLNLAGNDHHVISFVQHDISFAPMDMDPAETAGKHLIPVAMIRALLAEKLRRTLARFDEFRAVYPDARFLCIPPPPPVEDEAFLLAKGGSFADDIATCGITPAAIRRRVYLLQNELYQDAAERIGGKFLAPPADALTSGGFLAPGFRGNDPTHANARYGRLVLLQVVGEDLDRKAS